MEPDRPAAPVRQAIQRVERAGADDPEEQWHVRRKNERFGHIGS
jgi:hypothetical protein